MEENWVYGEEVLALVRAANRYCELMEQLEDTGVKELANRLMLLLPSIYKGSIDLPDAEESADENIERFVTEEDWENIHQTLMAKLGQADPYLDTFDPRMMESREAVVSSIAENLADIYQDLKDFLELYATGVEELMASALWELRYTFTNYWGQKLLGSLRALHAIVFGPEDLEELARRASAWKSAEDVDTSDWIISKRMKDYREDEDEEV